VACPKEEDSVEEPKERILVVEDDPMVRALMISILARSEREVTVVESAESALTYLAKHTADLMVVDKNLPGMDGVQLIERVRKQDKIIGIVMVTGYANVESAFRSLNLGVDGYMRKPFDVTSIEERVADAIQRRDRRARLQETLEVARNSLHSPGERSEPSLRFLVASPDSQQGDRLRRALASGKKDEVEVVKASSACLQRMESEPWDVVILDTALRDPDVITLISRAPRTQRPVFVVVGERPGVDALQRLIDLDVKAVIERRHIALHFADRIKSVASGLRLTKLANQRDP
jgi:DNA-binding response OmpR family regulator